METTHYLSYAMCCARAMVAGLLLVLLAGSFCCAEDVTTPAAPKPAYYEVTDSDGLIAAVAKIGPEGGAIVLRPGTYVIKEPLVFDSKSQVCISGAGWNTVIKKQGAGDAIVFRGSCWSCSVRNLLIEGDATAKTGSGIVFKEGEWSGINVVDYCHLRGFAESGVMFDGNPKKPFSSNTVSNCWFTNNLGDQLSSKYCNDFYYFGNQFGAGGTAVPRSGALLDHSSAGSYTLNYHWGNAVALRMIGCNFSRIENNRLEQSRENGMLIGTDKGGEGGALNIITGNTIHTNSEHNSGKFTAVEAYDATDVTFSTNQVFSWDFNSVKAKHAVLIGRGCKNWIVKDNILRHVTAEALVYDKKGGHIVKDNILDKP